MLLLFDIDGTLLTGNGVGRLATRAAMIEVFGKSGNIDAHHFAGKTDWYTLIELLDREGITPQEVARRLPDYERALAHHMAIAVQQRPVVPITGAHETLAQLRQSGDYLLGIVTGNLAATTPIKLRAAGFDPDWFPIGAYGSEAIERNDLPPIALKRANTYSGRTYTPDDVLVIGDTLMDIACARALGAKVAAVATGFSTREELEAAKPDYLIDSLTELLPIVGL